MFWLLAGGSHHSALFEFSDHLMLIDAPQNDARTLAVIAKALKPNDWPKHREIGA